MSLGDHLQLDRLSLPPHLRHVDLVQATSSSLCPSLASASFAIRFLIVVTFIEDSLRIISQFGDQLWYLQT